MSAPPVGRRTVLGATLALATGVPLLTACSADAPPPPVPLSQDERLLARTAQGVRELIAAYDRTTRAHPDLAARLAPFADDHRAHLAAVDPVAAGLVTPTPGAGGAATADSGLPAPSGSAAATGVPATPAAALAALAAAERAQARRRRADLQEAGGVLARLLAAIGACEAAHASLLAGRP